MLAQLVAFVGRDAFLEGVRAYFAEHAFGNTSLADLLAALEPPSGRDLTAWSERWLETAGVNTLALEVETDADGRRDRGAMRADRGARAPDAAPAPARAWARTTSSTAGSAARWRSRWTSTASGPRCPSWSAARGPRCCCRTTAT